MKKISAPLTLITIWCITWGVTSSDVSPNVFKTNHEPSPGFAPNLGNGFIAFDVGCPCGDETSSSGNVFLAGTYSGQGSKDPSKRAMIPHHLAIYVDYASSVASGASSERLKHSWEAVLDIEKGIFTNTSTFYGKYSNSSVCSISLSWLVHREQKDLVAVHATTVASHSTCSFHFRSCTGDVTDQISLLENKNGFTIYETNVPEVPDGVTHTVYSYHDVVPTSMTVNKGETENNMFVSIFQSSAWQEANSSLREWKPVSSLYDFEENVSNRISKYSWDILKSSHIRAWEKLWESGIEVAGNNTVAASVNASLYYILSAVDAEAIWSISPGGLSKNSYSGHVFWDCETWILPALVPFFPDLALSFAEYRKQRLPAALDRAAARGFSSKAAMMPWESAYTGMDVTPFGNYEGNFEIHVTADIPLAIRSIYYWTGNESWLQDDMWPLVMACTQYLAERASCADPSTNSSNFFESCQSFTYENVQPPDEKAGIVNDSVYTNAAAAVLLDWVSSYASTCPEWQHISRKMLIPLSTDLYSSGPVHPEYNGYHGEAINQADAVLLQFPLQFGMNASVAFNDLQYYAALTSVPGETKGFYTGDSSYSIAYMMLLREGFEDSSGSDLKELADSQFQQAFEHIDTSSFFVWKEKVDGGHYNFLTGAGGFLQNSIYGYAGLSISAEALILDSPLLPVGGVEAMKLRGLQFRKSSFSMWWNSSTVILELLHGHLTVYSYDESLSNWKLNVALTFPGAVYVTISDAKVKLTQ